MYRQLLLIFIFTLLTSVKALSQNDSIRQEQYSQEQQISKELQDKYNEIIRYLNKSKSKTALIYKKTFIESQKFWEKYVVNYCTLDSMPADETPRGSDSFYRECKIDKSKQRLAELNQQYVDIKSLLGD